MERRQWVCRGFELSQGESPMFSFLSGRGSARLAVCRTTLVFTAFT